MQEGSTALWSRLWRTSIAPPNGLELRSPALYAGSCPAEAGSSFLTRRHAGGQDKSPRMTQPAGSASLAPGQTGQLALGGFARGAGCGPGRQRVVGRRACVCQVVSHYDTVPRQHRPVGPPHSPRSSTSGLRFPGGDIRRKRWQSGPCGRPSSSRKSSCGPDQQR